VAEEKAKKSKRAKGAEESGGEQGAAAAAPKKELKPRVPSEIERRYEEILPRLMEQFGYRNRMEAPRLEKIVVNTSIKEGLQDIKILEAAAADIAAITGQRPVITRAKKSIANFKLRKGQPVGARVTLRRRMMYEFFNRFVSVALPRMRDFKGVSPSSFDGRGNYTIGLTEQLIFPEINLDKVSKVFGMNITFCTTAKTDEEGRALLGLLGMPFRAS